MLTPGPGPGPVNILPRLSHHALYSLQRHEIASEGKYRGSNKTAWIKRPPVGRPILLWALAINPDNSTCVFSVQKEVVKVMNKRKSLTSGGTCYLYYYLTHIVNSCFLVDAILGA